MLADIANGEHPFAAVLQAAARPMVIVGQGALAREDGLAVLARRNDRARAHCRQRRGVERLQRAAHGGGARRRSRSWLRAGSGRPRHVGDAEAADMRCHLSARRRRMSTSGHLAAPSRSIKVAMATAAPSAPMWCFRAPPTRKRAQPTSIPKAGCSRRSRPGSRQETPKKTGPSSARFPRSPGKRCRMTRLTSCARPCTRRRRTWRRSIRVEARALAGIDTLAKLGGTTDRRHLRQRDHRLLFDQRNCARVGRHGGDERAQGQRARGKREAAE